MVFIFFLLGLLQWCNSPAEGQNVRVYQFDSSSDQSVQVPQTPCPQIFQYQYGNNGWTGMIAVPPPSMDANLRGMLPIKLEIQMRVVGVLHSKYVGKLELAENKQTVLQKVLQGDSSRGFILYRLLFPSTTNLPILIMIKLNGNSICTGNPNSFTTNGRIITSIVLEHTFYPSANALNVDSGFNNNNNNNKNNNNDFNGGQNFNVRQNFNGGNFGSQIGNSDNTYISPIYPINDGFSSVPSTNSDGRQPFIQRREPAPRPQIIQGPQISHFPQANQGPQLINRPQKFQEPQVIQNPQFHSTTEKNSPPSQFEQVFLNGQDRGCGRPIISNLLVANGKKAKKGSWPWLVALFRKFFERSSGVRFACGGTLIHEEYVITAAHCVTEKKNMLDPEQLLLYLGKFNLGSWTETGVQPREVRAIHIHPDYQGSEGSEADIALLQLNEKAEYTQYVQPACIWPFQNEYEHHKDYTDLSLLIGKNGTVMGWGRDEQGNTVTQEPRLVNVPVVSQRECFNSHPGLRGLTSNRTMCAGSRDGSGPCNGDSGGGLMFQVKDNNDARWFLRGIVSLSLEAADRFCDLQNYIVYTDVAKFGDWLSRFIHFDSRMASAGDISSDYWRTLDEEVNPKWESIQFRSL